jgi:hypothetical protein
LRGTLDALHLASLHPLAEQSLRPLLGSQDQRLANAAHAMGSELFDLDRSARTT